MVWGILIVALWKQPALYSPGITLLRDTGSPFNFAICLSLTSCQQLRLRSRHSPGVAVWDMLRGHGGRRRFYSLVSRGGCFTPKTGSVSGPQQRCSDGALRKGKVYSKATCRVAWWTCRLFAAVASALWNLLQLLWSSYDGESLGLASQEFIAMVSLAAARCPG